MSKFQQVFCIIEKLFHSYSLQIHTQQLSKFVQIIINSNKSFVDLYEWIRDNLKITLVSASQLIKSLLSDEVYKLIAERKLYILLLYFEIVIQLGFQRSIYENQRKKISSILQSLDFGKDIFNLIKKCLKETYQQQYSFQEICEIRKNIVKTISRQLLKIIDIEDSQHYDVWFIKHEEGHKNYKISVFMSTKGSQSTEATTRNPIFSEKEEQQIQLPHRKMKISSFTPKMMFLGISIQLLMAHQQQLIQLLKCLRCLCADNLIDISHVQFFANGLVTQSQKNQIQQKLSIEMSNSEGDLQYFIQYLLKESKKDTNYMDRPLHYEMDYYKKVYKTIQNKYPLSQITIKKSMKFSDRRLEQFINEETLQQCMAQKRFEQASQLMKQQKKVDEQFPRSHLKIFELYSLNLIYRKIIQFFHDQFSKQEVAFRDNNHDCSSDSVRSQCQSQLNILQLFKIHNINDFLSQKLMKTQKMLVLQLQQIEIFFENNKVLNFPQLAKSKIKKILQKYSNDHLQANTSILTFGRRYFSLINAVTQIQDISQILMNLNILTIQNDLLQSSQKDLYINWQVKLRTLLKKVKHDLYLKSKCINIDDVVINQIEEFYQEYLSSSQNATIQSLEWIKAIRFKYLSTLFVTIKSQVDFIRYMLQKGEIRQTNLKQLSFLTSKLSGKEFISEYLSNHYKFNIRKLSKRLLKCKKIISFKNVSQIYYYGLYDQHIPFSQNFDEKKKSQQKQILNNNNQSQQQNQSEQSLKNIQLCPPNRIRILPYKQNQNRRQYDVDMQSTHQVEQNLQYVNQSYESTFYDEQKKTYDNILKENGGIINA